MNKTQMKVLHTNLSNRADNLIPKGNRDLESIQFNVGLGLRGLKVLITLMGSYKVTDIDDLKNILHSESFLDK